VSFLVDEAKMAWDDIQGTAFGQFSTHRSSAIEAQFYRTYHIDNSAIRHKILLDDTYNM
jgi:hypothetical protein